MPSSRLAPTGAGSSSGTLTVNGVAIALNSANASGFTEFAATVNSFANQTGGNIAISEQATSPLNVVQATVASGTATGPTRSFEAGLTLSTKIDGALSVTSTDAGEDLGLLAFTATDQRLNIVYPDLRRLEQRR